MTGGHAEPAWAPVCTGAGEIGLVGTDKESLSPASAIIEDCMPWNARTHDGTLRKARGR